MKILSSWFREFVDLRVHDRKLADDLTHAGLAVEGVSSSPAGTVFEMEITTNRVDAMNHYGVARECSAIYDLPLKPLQPKLPKPTEAPLPKGHEFKIEIADAEGCARFTARIVRGVTIQPSPKRIAERLDAIEARPINNVADATNYTLIEMGHPTHAYDLDLLEGHKLIVRRAKKGEKLKTLDGVERSLIPEDLVIADAHRAVGLAGIMGGFDTMITEKTKNVLIEAAWFDPASIRRSARRLGMHTDASHRFERGADWGATALACARDAELILETAAGSLEGGEIDTVARELRRPDIALTQSEVRRHLGQDIPEEEIERILRRLGFGLTPGRIATVSVPSPRIPAGSGGARAAIAEEPASVTVSAPTWRLDVEREIDLIEEVARIYGFNNFPNTLPPFSGAVVELPDAAKDAKLRSDALALGYNEAISLTFIARADAEAFSSATPVEIANPLSEEAAVMRTSMVPGMLNMLAYNLNRGTENVRLFESGNVYELDGAATTEHKVLCLGATGSAVAAGVHQPARPYTFFDLKGDIETLLAAFESQSLYFDSSSADFYHPGRSARAVIDGATVSRFGQLHPEIAAARKLRQECWLAEVFLSRLYQHALREPKYEDVPRFPAVERDFSFLFDQSVSFERIRAAIEALRIPELRRFQPVETFTGGAVPKGKYSLLLRAAFQSRERTLRDDEVAVWSDQVIKALQALGGTLRA